jgi:hypothetical protein
LYNILIKKILIIGDDSTRIFNIIATQLRPKKFKTTILSEENNIYCRYASPDIINRQSKLADTIKKINV